jgi:hypothetical protein
MYIISLKKIANEYSMRIKYLFYYYIVFKLIILLFFPTIM